MYILQVTASSNDNQHRINTTSNNIKIVSSDLLDDSNYYYNLQMKFNGTFLQADRVKYIAMVYNYFLATYNVQLIGTIACYSGSIMFVAGIDGSNATLQAIVSNGTAGESRDIIEGHSLLWFSLGSFETLKAAVSSSSSSASAAVSFIKNNFQSLL
jgi:hypothetical protein